MSAIYNKQVVITAPNKENDEIKPSITPAIPKWLSGRPPATKSRSIKFPKRKFPLLEIIIDVPLPEEIILDPYGYLFCWACEIPVPNKPFCVDSHVNNRCHKLLSARWPSKIAKFHVRDMYVSAADEQRVQVLNDAFQAMPPSCHSCQSTRFCGLPHRDVTYPQPTTTENKTS